MEQNFQTSFIPKKPMIEERVVLARSVSIFMVLSLILFSGVIIATGGLYFYEKYLEKNILSANQNLKLAENRFEPTKINELGTLDKRVRAAGELLGKHIVVSPVFALLEDSTQKTVRYTKFSYSLADDKSEKVTIKISGQATGYRAVALQSDLFAKHKEIIDPVFANLSLNDKGNVLFDLEFSVDPSFMNYKNALMQSSQGGTTSPPPAQ